MKNRILTVIIIIILLTIPVSALEQSISHNLGIITAPDTPYLNPPPALEITGIFKDSPAENRILVKDKITHINHIPIQSMPLENARELLNPENPVTLTVSRNNTEITLTLSPQKTDCTPENIAQSPHKLGTVKGFISGNYFRSNLSEPDGIKKGDSFFLYDENILIGTCSVSEMNDNSSCLRITDEYGKIDSIRQNRYKLLYAGYYPKTGRKFSPEEIKLIQAKTREYQINQQKNQTISTTTQNQSTVPLGSLNAYPSLPYIASGSDTFLYTSYSPYVTDYYPGFGYYFPPGYNPNRPFCHTRPNPRKQGGQHKPSKPKPPTPSGHITPKPPPRAGYVLSPTKISPPKLTTNPKYTK